jgi:hypothetical protein
MEQGAAPPGASAWLPFVPTRELSHFAITERIWSSYDAGQWPPINQTGSTVMLNSWANLIQLTQSDLENWLGLALNEPVQTVRVPVGTFRARADGILTQASTTWLTQCKWSPPTTATATSPSVDLPDWIWRSWEPLVGQLAGLPDEALEDSHLYPVYVTYVLNDTYFWLRLLSLRKRLAYATGVYFSLIRALAYAAHLRDRAAIVAAIIHTFMSHRHNRESDDELLSRTNSSVRYRRVAIV